MVNTWLEEDLFGGDLKWKHKEERTGGTTHGDARDTLLSCTQGTQVKSPFS